MCTRCPRRPRCFFINRNNITYPLSVRSTPQGTDDLNLVRTLSHRVFEIVFNSLIAPAYSVVGMGLQARVQCRACVTDPS